MIGIAKAQSQEAAREAPATLRIASQEVVIVEVDHRSGPAIDQPGRQAPASAFHIAVRRGRQQRRAGHVDDRPGGIEVREHELRDGLRAGGDAVLKFAAVPDGVRPEQRGQFGLAALIGQQGVGLDQVLQFRGDWRRRRRLLPRSASRRARRVSMSIGLVS